MTGGFEWQVVPLTVPLAVSGVLATVVTYGVWRERPKSGSTALAVTTAIIALWGFGQGLLVSGATTAAALTGLYVSQAALALVGLSWTVFALEYTGRVRSVSRRLVAVLAVEPLCFLALLATNGAHGLVYADTAVVVEAGRAVLVYDRGIAWFAHYGYQYLLLGWADWFLVAKFLGSRNIYRQRTFFLIASNVVLSGAHAVSTAGLSPLPHTTLGPVAFLVVGVAALFVLASDRFLALVPIDRFLAPFSGRSKSLAPVARNTAIEELEAGFLVTDHKNRIVDINPMGRRIMGAADERVVGKQLRDVTPGEVFERGDTSFLNPDVAGEFRGLWVQTRVDEWRCFNLTVTGVSGDQDDVAGRVALIHDVTESERRKEKLESRTEQLERKNDQLENFAGIVSHDLRNPLNVADGRLGLVDEDSEHVRTARDALTRMEEIISDILELATAGQTVSDTEPVDVAAVASDAWDTVETGTATVELAIDREIAADRARLRRVFENLFRNAVEHGSTSPDSHARQDAVEHGATSNQNATRSGDAVEQGSTSPDSHARQDAVEHGSTDLTVTVGPLSNGFYVEDDGVGIPEEDLDGVFAKGFTRSNEGSGFGLSICKTIVEAHGWKISATNGASGGARFEVVKVTDSPEPTIDST